MFITIVTSKDLYDGSCETIISTKEGKDRVCFGSGEPEDMNLARDLNDALKIYKLLEMAYNAGKNGETIEIRHKKQED